MAEALFWSSTEEGVDDLDAFFEYAGYKARDMREPLGEAKDHIQRTMELQFLTEGDYRSGGWRQLSSHYREWKIEHSPGTILVLTDEMRRIVLADDSWIGPTMTYVEFDPPSEKAGWHQEGAERDRGGFLPSRPILDLDEGDYAYIEHVFWEWLDELRSANIRRGTPDMSLRPSIF